MDIEKLITRMYANFRKLITRNYIIKVIATSGKFLIKKNGHSSGNSKFSVNG